MLVFVQMSVSNDFLRLVDWLTDDERCVFRILSAQQTVLEKDPYREILVQVYVQGAGLANI